MCRCTTISLFARTCTSKLRLSITRAYYIPRVGSKVTIRACMATSALEQKPMKVSIDKWKVILAYLRYKISAQIIQLKIVFYLSSSPNVVMAGWVCWSLLAQSISPCLQILTQPLLVSVLAVQLQNRMLNCLHWTSPPQTGSQQWHLLDDTFQLVLKAVVGCGLEQTPSSVVQV